MRAAQLAVVFMAAQGLAAPGEADLPALFASHRWFELRDAAASMDSAILLHRAAVAAAFDEIDVCERAIEQLLASDRSAETGATAHDMLCDVYFRHGRFREALVHALTCSRLRPTGSVEADEHPLLRALTQFPELRVAKHTPSSVHVWYKNGFVPVEINGRGFRCFIDTGCNLSLISESAAKKLGLSLVHTSGITMSDSTGTRGAVQQVAVAARFVIGGIELEHVPFVIVSDTAQPFADWSAGQRCVLGIQVQLACRTMRWRNSLFGAALDLGFPSAPRNVSRANLCFDSAMPHVAAAFHGRTLDMLWDTGADASTLDPRFAADFPAFVQANGRKSAKQWQGVVSETKAETILLPELALELDGHTITWRPIHILPPAPGTGRVHGLLGGEIMKPFREVTLDFGAMTLSLR